MTGQSLLDLTGDLHRELAITSGGADVDRMLRTLNAAQDQFETLVAMQRGALKGNTGTVTTSASSETTTYPTGLLRLDRLSFIDPDTSRPTYALGSIDDTGGHVSAGSGLLALLGAAPVTVGRPAAYWTDGTNFYWDPLPDATHTVRWYGMQRQDDITAGGTFAYDDAVALPLAVFAVELLRRGLDDPITDYIEMSHQIFGPLITMLRRFRRERASTRQYRYAHDT